jgi:predicted GNAT superfamily acetyltransferase
MATGEAARERAAVSATAVEIRSCHELEEFRACLELQKQVWGFTDAELVPLRMFVVAAKIGGQVIGAYQGRELVGFALAVPGARAGHPYLHSHMLAVRESHRNSGLGRKIKLFQREDALARGFELIEWTFDPLEIKNAYLNIERLAAITRRYNLNQYGITSSPLQGFLPTDRLVAEWWLRSRRVETFLNSGRQPEFETLARISVPGQIYHWKAAEATRARAAEAQGRNREAFLKAFAEGLAVLGYERDAEGNGTFLLGRWEENWSYADSP